MMLHKIEMSKAQVEALYDWFEDSPAAANVLIDTRDHGTTLYVAQGDVRATIARDGTTTDVD